MTTMSRVGREHRTGGHRSTQDADQVAGGGGCYVARRQVGGCWAIGGHGPRGAGAALSALGGALPVEQARIVQLLVQRVDIKSDGLELHFRTRGLEHVVQELGAIGGGLRRAA